MRNLGRTDLPDWLCGKECSEARRVDGRRMRAAACHGELRGKRTRTPIRIACLLAFALLFALPLTGCQQIQDFLDSLGLVPAASEPAASADDVFSMQMVPGYDGVPSAQVHDNVPFFTEDDLAREAFEEFSPLDAKGRCGTAFALVGPETMPSLTRGSIGMIRPSGWQVTRYDWIEGGYLFNRCHLIGYQLTGQNDNELNLITGTRTMNTQGMEPYENRVANYVYRTNGHVLYRVTPYFNGSNLVADGVLMEAQSIEDKGKSVRFCVWCYNVEPGVIIDYATGESEADGTLSQPAPTTNVVVAPSHADEIAPTEVVSGQTEIPTCDYVLNTNSLKFHRPDCTAVADMKEHNKKLFFGTRDEAIELGYVPCGICKP